MIQRLWSFLKMLVRRSRFEDAMTDEVGFHLDAYADDLVRTGVSPAEARRRARLEFGGIESVKEDCRQARGVRLADELRQDLRHGLRLSARTPGFTLAAILTLALGIGANAAIFSLLHAVLLRTLPVSAPHELFFVAHGTAQGTSTSSNYPFLERVRDHQEVFAGVTAYTLSGFKVSAGGDVELTTGQFVSGNYHGLLGVPIVFGRGFTSEDDHAEASARLAVISDGYWTRRFGRAQDVIGTTLIVQGHPVSIIGVTAPGFDGLESGQRVDVTLTLAAKTFDVPDFLTMHDTWTSMPLVARLNGGVTETQASAALDTVFRQYLSEPDNQWFQRGPGGQPRTSRLLRADRGSASLRNRYATSLGVLMGFVGLVLLIACANVANLQLARGAARAKEIAVRLSIGAARGRVVRQLLTESLVLALTGGALGLLLAMWGTETIASLFGGGFYPVVLNVEPNATVTAFTTAISVLTGLVFGLTPALRTTHVELTSALKERTASAVRTSRRWNTRRVLIVAQISLCLVLLVGAGLLVRTLRNLYAPDASFNASGVLMFSLQDNPPAFPSDRLPTFCAALVDRLSVRPEIDVASCSTSTPVDMAESRRSAVADGTPVTGGIFANVVTPEFFRTFGIAVVRGRALTAQDSPTSQKVAIINERLARTAFAGRDPIGRTFHFRAEPDQQIIVVGIARDVRQSPRDAPPPAVYTPLGQGGEIERRLRIAVRSTGAPSAMVELLRAEVRSASGDVIMSRPTNMDEQIGGALVRERALAMLSGWFGVLAVVLACIGLYGVMSYEVARRRREIGIRLALGADPGRVRRLVLRQTAALAVAGIAVGLLAALATTRVLSDVLFGLSARDPLTLAVAAGVLAITTLLAGYLPARRAAGVDPTVALRME